MELINKNSALWNYISEEQKGLILVGEQLVSDVKHFTNVSDYSFLVFPFSKAYEGFLKQLFLDLNLIRNDEYYSDEIRIGKLLNPYYVKDGNSLYQKLCRHEKGGEDITERLWRVWRRGRNQVFHYFPHNFRKISYDEAVEIIKEITNVMETAVERCEFGKDSISPLVS